MAVAFAEVRHFQPDDLLHCEGVEVRGAELDWTIPAHRHAGLHQFLWLARGQVALQLDGQPQQLAAPGVLMVAPGCVHALRYTPDSRGWQVSVPGQRLAAVRDGLPALAARLSPSRQLPLATGSAEAREAAQHFGALAEEFNATRAGRAEALQALLVLLVLWFLRRCDGPLPAAASPPWRDTLVQRYRALVEQCLRSPQPLGWFAAQLQVTPDHLSRSCRAVTGLSALELLHERRLLEARRLLAYTTAGVAEVAQELGFDDPAYFSRFFARRAGCPPAAWRLALREGRVAAP